MWPERVSDERMLTAFGKDSIRRALHVRRRNCVPTVEPQPRLTSTPAQLVQGILCWFGHATKRPEGSSSGNSSCPHRLPRCENRAGGQLKDAIRGTLAISRTFLWNASLPPRRWRKDWVKVFCELALYVTWLT